MKLFAQSLEWKSFPALVLGFPTGVKIRGLTKGERGYQQNQKQQMNPTGHCHANRTCSIWNILEIFFSELEILSGSYLIEFTSQFPWMKTLKNRWWSPRHIFHHLKLFCGWLQKGFLEFQWWYRDFSAGKIKIPNHRGLSGIWTVIISTVNFFLRWSWCFWQCFAFKFFVTKIKSRGLMRSFSKNLFSSFFILCSREWISAWYWWCWCFAWLGLIIMISF